MGELDRDERTFGDVDLAGEAEAISERQEDGIPRLAELKEELQRISNALCGIQLGIEGIADWQYGLRGRRDCRSEKMVDLALLVRVDYYSLLRHMENLEQLAWADEGGF